MSEQMPGMLPIRQQRRQLLEGRRSLCDEVELLETRANAVKHLNPLAWVDWTRARRQAQALSSILRNSENHNLGMPLLGTWVSVKDLFQWVGTPLRAGTRAVLPTMPDVSSAVVQRLEAAGALVFAKTNMHEIALGATGENVWTGDVCNPADPARQSGGSSSGSGVAVATGLGSVSIGSDTGGSIRIPAAFCGVVGFKPTHGHVPLAGSLPLSWTCDHAGPLTRSVEDAALVYRVLSGHGLGHGRVARRPRLGVPRRWLAGRLDAGMREHFDRLLAGLAAVADVVDAEPPDMDRAWRNYTPVVRAEAAWVHRDSLAAGGEGFSDGVLIPLRLGQQLPARDYIDALRTREAFIADLNAVLNGVDAMVLPTTAIVTPLRGQQEARTLAGTLNVREAVLGQTLPFSFAGVPAISLPAGTVEMLAGSGDGSTVQLPVGLQVVARRDADAQLLALAAWLEDWLAAEAVGSAD
ncbi:MAG: amidase [Lautropia sp.]|nr:amidase [Lautropia sp.]